MTTEINQPDIDNVKQAAPVIATLLFVDDEPNILSSLRRLFRPLGYRVLTAESGEQGLKILAEECVDLVISDMRMPEMNGAQFLEQVRERSPFTIRILLTGYADIASTIEAINKGQIFRYLAKPWEDNDIILSVRHAIERQQLEREKLRLEALTQKQNDELRELNASLEDKVRARTEELHQAMGLLEQAHDKLKKSFVTSLQVFSNLIELRDPTFAGHSRRVADLARTVAQNMGLSASEVQDVFVAGLLHDVGKIGLSDNLLKRPWSVLTPDEKNVFGKHSMKGEASLMALEPLHEAAKLIRSHHERIDGLGYPDGLIGDKIALGARILAAINDFDAMQIGTFTDKKLTAKEALAFLNANKAKRYDPNVVNVLIEVVTGPKQTIKRRSEVQVVSSQLTPGMVLARDLYNQETIMLLPKGCILDERYIEKIRAFERADGRPLNIFIQLRAE
jgi:response regulator RpfG family c-di-GMP phosphodiesterase